MSIFDRAAALAELTEDRLPEILSLLDGMPSEAALLRKLEAAEAEVERKLAVPLSPVEVFPMVPPTAEELAALGDTRWEVEPGYDMEEGMLGTFQWTSIHLRRRPILAVHSVQLVYPTITTPIYDVPLDWVYPDHKAGLLQFTPKPTSAGLAPSIMGAALMARGGAVPQMIRVRYRAGLDPTSRHMAEVRDLVMRIVVLKHIKFTPQSASISGDGLSQSKSFDVNKFREAIDDDLADLRESLRGPTWAVL